MRTVAALVATLCVGVVSGAATVLVHTSGWPMALGLAAALAAVLWLRGAGQVGFALGWAVALGRASTPRPEGDYLVSADAPGWTLLACSLVLVVGALVAAARGQGRARDLRLRGAPS